MNIGVFLLIEPFASVETQLQRAKEMGFDYADHHGHERRGKHVGDRGLFTDGQPR